MTTKQYRHPAEADACTKETGHDPKQGRTPSTSTSTDSTVERELYLPLAWAEIGRDVKPQRFKGKTKRKARADAINAKRYQGGIGLFDALAWVSFGACLATAILWLIGA